MTTWPPPECCWRPERCPTRTLSSACRWRCGWETTSWSTCCFATEPMSITTAEWTPRTSRRPYSTRWRTRWCCGCCVTTAITWSGALTVHMGRDRTCHMVTRAGVTLSLKTRWWVCVWRLAFDVSAVSWTLSSRCSSVRSSLSRGSSISREAWSASCWIMSIMWPFAPNWRLRS